jgi:hypothetical protein
MNMERNLVTNSNLDSMPLTEYTNFLGAIVTEDELCELQQSSLLMEVWSRELCANKATGGMEDWGKNEKPEELNDDNSCSWYHGTWQYLQLLNMVAIPRWYPFYNDALCDVLEGNPRARVMISAAADYGMLRTLHDAMCETKATNPPRSTWW